MFSASLEVVLTIAYREAVSRRHAYVTLEHLLYALAHDTDGERILAACGTDLPRLRRELDAYLNQSIEQQKRGDQREPEQTAAFRRVLQTAVLHVQSAQRAEVEAGDICAAILQQPKTHAAQLLAEQGVTRLDVLEYISHGISKTPVPGGRAGAERGAGAGDGDEGTATARDPLAAYCTNLTERARQGLLDPLIGRADELQRTIEVLCRRRKNNPVFVGDAGVGKTAMAEGLAMRLLADDVQEALKGAEIFALDTGGPARRHALPRRFRGALQGGHQGAQRPAEGDPLHRRDPLDRRRRRDHRRHDGPGDADQADPHRRRSARHRLDDLRGVQAHREGSRARAAAAEDRDRRAVDRGGGEDSRRAAQPLRRAPSASSTPTRRSKRR